MVSGYSLCRRTQTAFLSIPASADNFFFSKIFLPSSHLNTSLPVQLKRKERTMEVLALLSSHWQEVLGYRARLELLAAIAL